MKICIALLAALMALVATQAQAEHFVIIDRQSNLQVEKDSIRRGGDGLVYATSFKDPDVDALAVDCRARKLFVLRDHDTLAGTYSDDPDWRNHGTSVSPNTLGEVVVNYVCANVR
jgi:hypothetical protein